MTVSDGEHGADDAAVLWDVVDDHLDVAEFLSEQWLLAARSALFSLDVIEKTLGRRLEAHLDGLSLGGEVVAEKLLRASIAEATLGQEGRFAACALGLLADPAPGTVERVIAALVAATKPKVRSGLQKALAMSARGDVDEPVRLALYAADKPEVQTALLAVLAARRVDPGPILRAMLSDARPPAVRAAAAGAAAATADRSALYPVVEAMLGSSNAAMGAAALRTGLIWGSLSAWRACAEQAASGQGEAMVYLAMLDGNAAMPILTQALVMEGRRADALLALGFTGLPEAADACQPHLDAPELPLARLAGEAMAAIAGFSLDDRELGTRRPARPPGDDLPSLADDLSEELMPTPIDALAVPIAPNVRRWWTERKGAFAGGRRYLRGQPFGVSAVQDALRAGSLRRAGPLACELAIRSGGEVQLPALRLRYPKPELPPGLEGVLHRPPRWR